MITTWIQLHPRATEDMLGYVPSFLDENDPRPAKEQFNERYVFGGWRPTQGITISRNLMLLYPGDPPQHPLWASMLRDEKIVVYEHDWIAIIQKDGSYEVARMD